MKDASSSKPVTRKILDMTNTSLASVRSDLNFGETAQEILKRKLDGFITLHDLYDPGGRVVDTNSLTVNQLFKQGHKVL